MLDVQLMVKLSDLHGLAMLAAFKSSRAHAALRLERWSEAESVIDEARMLMTGDGIHGASWDMLDAPFDSQLATQGDVLACSGVLLKEAPTLRVAARSTVMWLVQAKS